MKAVFGKPENKQCRDTCVKLKSFIQSLFQISFGELPESYYALLPAINGWLLGDCISQS